MRTVIVIGAGAAGMTAALRAAQAGASVTLLNAHPKVGLKILMSGGTRCNVTHRAVSEKDYFGGSRHVVARMLRAFTPAQTLDWFEHELRVPLKLEDTGKYFPQSDDAQSVLDALLNACEQAGVRLVCGARAIRLRRDADNDAWAVGVQQVHDSNAFDAGVRPFGESRWEPIAREPDDWYAAERLVLATGGLSFPRTGSDGAGYSLAAALGHTVVPPVPALTPLGANDPLCEAAQGATLDAELTLWADGKRAEQSRGSLLFAHFGYSGPAALDLSRHFNRAAGHERRVTANFVGLSREKLLAHWMDTTQRSPRLNVRGYLGEWLPLRVATELSWEAEIDPARLIAQVAKPRRDTLLQVLTERDLHVTHTLGYEKAEVTAGGVALDEVDASTLESRKAPGVFLCGEILDVEGRLGGFNFQWAWSSGTVAGRAAALK